MTDTSKASIVAQRGVWAATTAYRAALLNPDSDIIREALTRKCDQCQAPAGVLCRGRKGFSADLAGRLIHHGRRMKP
jgi:hypothetical protein